MRNKYARVFAIISQINKAGGAVTDKILVSDFTEGRATSLKDLTDGEFQEFERNLVKMAPNKLDANAYKYDPLDRSRKAIIAQFKSIGRTAEDAIAWAEKYGVKNQKKKFNEYTGQELFVLIKSAEKVKQDFIKSVNKKLNGV